MAVRFRTQGTQTGALDATPHRLFLSDQNRRVLVFNLDSGDNLMNKVPAYVLGQPDFTTSDPATTPSGNDAGLQTGGLVYDGANNRLFYSDSGNNRVLVYDLSSGI